MEEQEKRKKVEAFLQSMNVRLSLGDRIEYDHLHKNREFLAIMEWRGPERDKYIRDLKAEDYVLGPIQNIDPDRQEIWVFGKRIIGRLCYIKICMAIAENVCCISFHLAERDMFLPLQNKWERV